jgi:HD-GYP domain-containing protein (c-di-GMP phosphodiesterase class II)
MVSERTYQAARSVTAALAELERCAGPQFDPTLLPLFREVLATRQQAQAGDLSEASETHELLSGL